ncbi:MAG: cell division protein ZapA [Succinivibrio sp.]
MAGENGDPNEIVTVNFTILGNSFSLKVRKSQKDNLLGAVEAVKERSSSMLRQNPTLSAPQAAILAAIDSESALRAYLGSNTPFQDQAFSLVRRISQVLGSTRGNG